MCSDGHLVSYVWYIPLSFFFFFFQAEDGIRDAQESRGLGDVYKRQTRWFTTALTVCLVTFGAVASAEDARDNWDGLVQILSLIHI